MLRRSNVGIGTELTPMSGAASTVKSAKTGSLRLRGKILLLYSISTLLLLAAACAVFWEFNVALQAFSEVRISQNNAISVEATEADFKKQVQEWKDTLLRGKKPEDLNKYWGNFQQRESDVRSEAERLSHNISDAEAARLVTQFISAHQNMGDGYRRGLQAFKDHDFDSAAGDAAVAGVDRAPTELLTKARERLVSQASALATKANDNAYRAMWVTIALFAVVTGIGVMIFLVAVQKNISCPLARLTAGMRELATGNFDVVLAGLGRGDEIGDIAGAVEIFKVKAAEKAQHEAEQEKTAALERDAAARRMADEFQETVGGIVKAAVAGDFSQRVDLNGKSGLVLNVGTALNRCARTSRWHSTT